MLWQEYPFIIEWLLHPSSVYMQKVLNGIEVMRKKETAYIAIYIVLLYHH